MLLYSQRDSRLSHGCAIYSDERDRRALDMNPMVAGAFMKTVEVLLPLPAKRLVFAGSGRLVSMVVRVLKQMAPSVFSAMEIVKHDDVREMVVDPEDIPDYWFGNGQGKPYSPEDRRNVWCYERCLSEENRITTKDLYNPEPWPYDEFDYAALGSCRGPEAEARVEALEAIPEDEEGDEGW